MPTLAACLKKHLTNPSDRELVHDAFTELKESMPAPKAAVQAVREAMSAVEDERDTFLGNLEKKHNVVLERPERMPAAPERGEEKPPEAKVEAKAEQPPEPEIEFQLEGFYSELTKQVQSIKQARNSPQGWKQIITKNLPQKGVTQEEIAWSGVLEWLEGQTGKVTKESLVGYLQSQEVQIEETVYGDESKSITALRDEVSAFFPGTDPGDISTGMLASAGASPELVYRWEGHIWKLGGETKFHEYQMEGKAQGYRELTLRLPGLPGTAYTEGHYQEPNVVAHVRFNERTDENGKKTLFIEEIQSDWHQQGRKKGYGYRLVDPEDANPDGSNVVWGKGGTEKDARKDAEKWVMSEVQNKSEQEEILSRLEIEHDSTPVAPFKKSWPTLAVKRMIRYAAENGFEQIAWTPGEVQAERYDLSKTVGEVVYTDSGMLMAYGLPRDGSPLLLRQDVPKQEISDHIGKEAADKLLKQEPNVSAGIWGKRIVGDDLKIGGEGMKGFYDKILRDQVNKYVKKFKARVGASRIDVSPDPQKRYRLELDGAVSGVYQDLEEATEAAETRMWAGARIVSEDVKPIHLDSASQEVWSVPVTTSMREAAGGGQPMFQLGQAKTPVPPGWKKPADRKMPPPITVERATEIAKRVYQREGIKSPIRIMNNLQDLKPDVLDPLNDKYEGKLGRPRGLRSGKTIYIFADYNYTEEAVEETILHELLHVGNSRKFGRRYKQMMKRLYDDLGGQDEIQKLADKYGVGWFVEHYRDRIKAQDWEIASELMSFVGMKAEDKSLPGRVRLAIKRVLGAFRQLLREYGFLKSSALNDAELSVLIKRALEAARAPEAGIEPIMTQQWGVEMESVELQDSRGFARDFASAFKAMDKKGDNYVNLLGLRKALPQYSKAEFDKGIYDLRVDGTFDLSAAEGRFGISPEERAAGIREGDSLLLFASHLGGGMDFNLQDVEFQLQEDQDNSNLYANRPAEEVDTVVQAIKDYAAGRSGKGIGSEVVEDYGWWDRFIGTVDNIAAKNLKSLMPKFFDKSKHMRMDQDETFALTNVAVTAFNRLKQPEQAKLKRALLEGTLVETKLGMGKEWNRDQLRDRFGLTRDGMQSYDDIRAYMDEIKDRHLKRLLERVGVVQEGLEVEVIGKTRMEKKDRDAAIAMLEGMIQSETKKDKKNELKNKVLEHKRDAKLIELGNRIVDDFDNLRGYFPLMRFGDYTIAVRKPPVKKGEVGELVHFEQAESKREMRRKAGRLRRLYSESYSVDTGKLEKFTGESMINDPRLMSMLRDYVEMAGEGIEIVDAVEQEMLKKFAEQSFRKRMIHRKGIPGYDENINRVLASYGWSASNYLSKLKFIPELQAIYEAEDAHKYPGVREHMGTQIEYMRGGVEGASGEEFSWFKSMTFAMYMGLNIKSAAVNLTQVPMVLYPYLAGKYNDARAVAAITKAQKAAMRPKKTGNDTLDKLMAWAEKEGLTMDMYLSDLMGMARGKRLAQARLKSKAVSGLSFMFSHAERFNRRVSAAAEFYANPDRSYADLQKAIEQTVRTTQFDYGKHNRGRIFQGWTSMPMQFHQFTVNYLQFLNPKKHGWGTTMRAMGMLWLAAGVMATPGTDDLRALIEFLAQKAFGTHLDLEMWARKAIVDSSREYFGDETAKTIAETVLRGQGAYMAGDIAGSLSNSRLIPGFSKMLDVAGYRGLKEGLEAGILDAAGAGPGFIANSLRGVEDALRTGDIRRAAERGPVPVAVQNLLKAIRTGSEGVDRDVSGRVQIAYSPTLADSILQGMSIQPSARSKLYRIKNRQMRESKFVQGQHSQMLTKLAIGYAERDRDKIREARADIARWNRLMPRQWRLKADKVKRSIRARRRRFDISSTTGMDPIMKQLRPSLRAERAQYYQ